MNLLALTRDLVAIPSHEDETAAGDAVEDWLREHAPDDATIVRDEAPGGGNVLARRSAGSESASDDGADPADARSDEAGTDASDADTLALVGHHDVVPPDESQIAGDAVAGGAFDGAEYRLEERTVDGDRRLFGRGTADMKGPLAAAMCAFASADLPPGRELVFASFVGEETGGEGARHAIEHGFAPDRAVVVEGSTGYSAPGVTDVAVAHKGRRGSTIVAEGQSAHASEVEAGVNAIYRATDAVDVVRDLDAPSATVLGHEIAGSIAVTEIEGGSAWNVIPERCTFTVDERTVPGDRAELARVEDVDGVEWTVDQDLPPMACGDAAFADRVLEAALAVQDGEPEHVVKPHATDAGWLADRAETDCVIVGAAEPGEAHTADESVSIEVLERCRALYRRVAETPAD